MEKLFTFDELLKLSHLVQAEIDKMRDNCFRAEDALSLQILLNKLVEASRAQLSSIDKYARLKIG